MELMCSPLDLDDPRSLDPRPGFTNQTIANELSISPRTMEAHVRKIFLALDLPESPDIHRRVLAVLTHLRAGM
jgi:DNA-binding NarL/FixJ family response regulator